MNAKRTCLVLTVAILLMLALAACGRWGLDGAPAPSQIKPSTAVPTPTAPFPSAIPSAGVELTILASGSGVTVLEYQGAGVRCIIASGGGGVDMVCQSSETVPAQPTPDGPDKHQTQPQGLEANAVEFPPQGDGTPVLAG